MLQRYSFPQLSSPPGREPSLAELVEGALIQVDVDRPWVLVVQRSRDG